MSKIEWTDLTWNPGIYGCEEVSPACAHCYAAGMAHRLVAMGRYPEGVTVRRASGVHWSGRVVVADEVQGLASLPKRAPKRVFVTSMSDLFHEDVPDWFLGKVFDAMEARPHLTFQVLTKRPERMARWAEVLEAQARAWPANVWAGTTVEDQRRADERIPHLLRVPARARFLSCEPLLGPVDLGLLGTAPGPGAYQPVGDLLHWVITGGESGTKARPSNPAWFRSLRDQCDQAGVAFFFKQWGEWQPGRWDAPHGTPTRALSWDGRAKSLDEAHDPAAGDSIVQRRGRPADPKTLDGVAHRAFPEAA